MNFKLNERIVAFLLIFTMILFSFPFVSVSANSDVDIVLNYDETEESNTVASGLVDIGDVAETMATYTLSYWYSNTTYVGYWSSMPWVYYTNLDSSSNFTSSVQWAAGRWSSTLGITINTSATSSQQTVHPLQIFGGSPDLLEDLNIFSDSKIWDDNTLGLTTYISYNTRSDVLSYGSNNYTCWQLSKVRVFVKNLETQNAYYNVTTHELGHALGWHGHSSYSSDLMYAYSNGVTAPQTRDNLHLKQIYDLLY